jgi:hypothetical protein
VAAAVESSEQAHFGHAESRGESTAADAKNPDGQDVNESRSELWIKKKSGSQNLCQEQARA